MSSTFGRYQKDIDRLSQQGRDLYYAIFKQYDTKQLSALLTEEELGELPDFTRSYQPWYSEALSLLSQILPERVEDFKAYYAPKTTRKSIDNENYTINDCLRGLQATAYNGEVRYSPIAAAPAMFQQFTIIEGLKNRFESALYDIKTLVHADILDDELHAAEELNKSGYQRGAGAVAGVVLEGHLASVCERHKTPPAKRKPTLSDFYQALKEANVIDTSQWRFIQHLSDIRNKCDHKLTADPTKNEVTELIDGVRRITKTVL